ncbi:MAG: hypothetical protein NTY90_04275 [Candidatus Micrarchaeota archaeon]|nr:hypothetical protein [Candidatus Micrarchaeota archaeon]
MSNSLLRAGVFFSILAGLLVFGAVLVSAYGFVPSAAPAARGGSFTTATPTPVPSPVEIISTPVPSSTGNAFSNNAPVIIASSTSTSSSGETSATSSVLVRSRPVHMRMAQASISGCVDGGDCVLSTDAELPTGSVLNYHSFTIPSGVTLTIRDGTNGGSLTINAVDVTIAGTITSAGTNGGDGQDGKLFGRNGASGGAGGAGGTVTINADGRVEVTDSGRISVNGGDGGQGGDNTCVGDCKASAGGNGGNAGAVSIRAADLTVNGIVFASGGSGGKGGFGDGCDGHGGNGGIGGSGGTITLKYITYTQRQPQALSGNYSITGGGFGGIARDIRTTANNIMTTPLQTWAGSGGLGGGHDTDWLCKIDGYSGSNGRAGASGSMGTVTTIQRVLATITITPATATVQSGSGQMFAANGVDTEGFVYPVSPIWAVTDPTIGSIPVAASSAALFTANLVGTTTITASQNGVSGTATVTVTPGPNIKGRCRKRRR